MTKTKSNKKDEGGIDLYSLTDNVQVLEEIDNLGTQAREKKKQINRLELAYKDLSHRFKTLLYTYGKPKKLNGPTWIADRQSRSWEKINKDKLQKRLLQEKGIKVDKVLEIIAYATEVETTEYYVLRGKKGVEETQETQDDDTNGEEINS